MLRKIIKIDEELCNGCGLCASACHEGAIAIKDGKAKLIRDDYCDGLGNCLPVCPTGAITFEEREAAAYDEEAVKKHIEAQKPSPTHGGCPGSMARTIQRENPAVGEGAPRPAHGGCPGSMARAIHREEQAAPRMAAAAPAAQSELMQWPVQIKLVPLQAPYFDGANLLIAADCTAYAYSNFHSDFIRNHVTLIGCPKLDAGDYAEKLTEILKLNRIRSVKVVRMQVPCCGGLEDAVKRALLASGKMIPWQVVVISTDGEIVDM
ncbi:MAG: 4Fe-4S binding protein [Bacillota bacterium]